MRIALLYSLNDKTLTHNMGKIYTIGHSNRELREFLDLLIQFDIHLVVDVRSIPKSRYVPWFNQDDLRMSLQEIGIEYKHLKALGGRRTGKNNSENMGWRNKSFRGYADYMQTVCFYNGLKELYSLFKKDKHLVLMCAEAVPWRCHRSLIADALTIRHKTIWNIINHASVKKHKLTSFAQVDHSTKPLKLIYPKNV